MTCYNCKKQIKEKDIAIEKSVDFGNMTVGFFVICQECYEKLDKEELKSLEEEYKS